jgi:tetratricopeptide (TPR) repeat protein
MSPSSWREVLAQAHAARQDGRADIALAQYRLALALAPDRAETQGAFGLALLEAGRLDEAAAHVERAAALAPSLPATQLILAELRAQQGDLPRALAIVEALAARAPADAPVLEKRGELEARAGRYRDAAAHFRAAVERRRGDPGLLFKWARATYDAGATEEARGILGQAARLAPGHPAILRLDAEIAEREGDWSRLAAVAQDWLRREPANALALRLAATAQWETGYLAQAMQSYRAFLARAEPSASDLATYGRLCLSALAHEEAARAFDDAERLDPGSAHMLSGKATLAMFEGRFDDAAAHARRAIRADPVDAAAYKVLVQVSEGHLALEEFADLERLAARSDLPLDVRIPAAYAVADCLDAAGDADRAFAVYERANALARERAAQEGLAYDRDERRRQVDWLIARFPSAPPAREPAGGPIPIFVVGMPRSGTTLVESILGAHSRVLACGERQAMRTIMQELVARDAEFGAATRRRWREAFWRDVPEPSRYRAVTDKNPWNFDALGLILDLFPAARVVHVRRDPVETGLSVFRNEFPKFATFSHRLDDIGHYYGEYARLMAHWERALGSRYLTIPYERLVADLDTVARELVSFCGLDWEDACRDFAAARRVIATMSAAQARRPVSGFRGRKARYARHLGPLVAALEAAGVDLATGARRPG